MEGEASFKITCQEEYSAYMKYLFSLASSQKRKRKGLFDPTEIHLMENQQVLTNLLIEQKDFLNKVTSHQLEGISQESMDNKTEEDKSSIRDLLMNCEEIVAVEKTYHTEKKGQWLLVIKQNQNQTVTQYINKNIEKLYKKRNKKTSRLITYTLDIEKMAYRLKIIPTYTGKVGTYDQKH